MKRRGLLGAILMAGMAPALASAGLLMKITPRQQPVLWGDGVHDDTLALQALIDRGGIVHLPLGTFRISKPLLITRDHTSIVGGHIKARNVRHMIEVRSKYARFENMHLDGGVDATMAYAPDDKWQIPANARTWQTAHGTTWLAARV